MNKKEYIEPQMGAIMMRNCSQLLAGSGPDPFDEVSDKPSYGRDLFNSEEWDLVLKDY